MIQLDYIFIGIITISAFVGLSRGLIREIAAIISWVLAYISAARFDIYLEPFLEGFTNDSNFKNLLAFAIIFAVVFAFGMFLGSAIRKFFGVIGFGLFDRLLGSAVGAAKGIIIVLVVANLISISSYVPVRKIRDSIVMEQASWFTEKVAKRIDPQLRRVSHYLASLEEF